MCKSGNIISARKVLHGLSAARNNSQELTMNSNKPLSNDQNRKVNAFRRIARPFLSAAARC